jgi:hypothetical protein
MKWSGGTKASTPDTHTRPIRPYLGEGRTPLLCPLAWPDDLMVYQTKLGKALAESLRRSGWRHCPPHKQMRQAYTAKASKRMRSVWER